MCHSGFHLVLLLLEGFRLLFQDAKEIRRIQTRVLTENIGYENLPYRDLEKLRQVSFFEKN